MAPQSLARRVDTLEHRVEALEVLPERLAGLELQFVQFREEVRGEFSAVRAELRAEIQAGDEETRRLMRTLDDETRQLMRVLHEDIIARLTILQEGQQHRPPGGKTAPKARRFKRQLEPWSFR